MSESCCAPETSCCEPVGTSSNCCDSSPVQNESVIASVLLFVGLIAAFIAGDYLLPSLLEGKVNENLLFFILFTF